VDIRWRPLVSVAVVTRLVAHLDQETVAGRMYNIAARPAKESNQQLTVWLASCRPKMLYLRLVGI
jgi:hypothetical protein